METSFQLEFGMTEFIHRFAAHTSLTPDLVRDGSGYHLHGWTSDFWGVDPSTWEPSAATYTLAADLIRPNKYAIYVGDAMVFRIEALGESRVGVGVYCRDDLPLLAYCRELLEMLQAPAGIEAAQQTPTAG